MPKFVTNVEPFWQQELKDHTYARTVDWSAKNFDHLNKEDYNTGHFFKVLTKSYRCVQKLLKTS